MAQSHGASIHIDAIHIEAKLANHAKRLHGKSLVEFVEVDVIFLPARLLPDFMDSADRSHHHPLRLDSAGGLRDDPDHGSCAQLFCALGAGHDQRCRSVVDSGSVAGGDGAILLECRLE